jgi:Na+/glutamate symporter
MFEMADYKLSDMLGIAGATIGIIIAGGVLLGAVVGRYSGVFDRYRSLTGELRANDSSDPRRGSLNRQVNVYRKQIVFLNYGSLCLTLALLCFLVTVGIASMSVIFPKAMILRALGTLGLFAGLLLIAVAVFLLMLDTLAERPMIVQETSDLEGQPSPEEAHAR